MQVPGPLPGVGAAGGGRAAAPPPYSWGPLHLKVTLLLFLGIYVFISHSFTKEHHLTLLQ